MRQAFISLLLTDESSPATLLLRFPLNRSFTNDFPRFGFLGGMFKYKILARITWINEEIARKLPHVFQAKILYFDDVRLIANGASKNPGFHGNFLHDF